MKAQNETSAAGRDTRSAPENLTPAAYAAAAAAVKADLFRGEYDEPASWDPAPPVLSDGRGTPPLSRCVTCNRLIDGVIIRRARFYRRDCETCEAGYRGD